MRGNRDLCHPHFPVLLSRPGGRTRNSQFRADLSRPVLYIPGSQCTPSAHLGQLGEVVRYVFVGTFRSMHGHIRQLGPGRYLVRISAGRDPVTGKRSQPSRTIHGSRRDAELALAELRVEHSRCLTPLSDITLDVLIDQFLSAPTRSGSPRGPGNGESAGLVLWRYRNTACIFML